MADMTIRPDDVPVVDSVPADAPSTVRCVLPCASPLTVRELALLIVVVAVSTRDVSPSSRPPGPRPRPHSCSPRRPSRSSPDRLSAARSKVIVPDA